LITTSSGSFFFLTSSEDELKDVETELNHTPMDRNRDLTDEAALPSESGRDHAGLLPNRWLRCSGVRLPDDDDRLPRRSRPDMLLQLAGRPESAHALHSVCW
jgi:hypothetical protein